MDVHQLVAAIAACANPDAGIRRAGEEALKQVHISLCLDIFMSTYAVCLQCLPFLKQTFHIARYAAICMLWGHCEFATRSE